MHLRIYTLACCAILMGFATAAQAGGQQRDSDISIDDAYIEGSGGNGEVGHDLDEASGSGGGPDDEDTPIKPHIHTNQQNKQEPIIPKKDIGLTVDETFNSKDPPPSSTPDTSVIMNPKQQEPHTSFFAQPGILAAVIGGAVVGLLCAILVVMFIVYRMRKKDEGSYALGEPKQSPTTTSYSRGNQKEFFA